MADVKKTTIQILDLFKDGQGPDSMSAQDQRDFVVSCVNNKDANITLENYKNTRDDGVPALNILSTDANGKIISTPNEVLFVGAIGFDGTTQTKPSSGVKKAITLDTISIKNGVTHGTLPQSEFTIGIAGKYRLVSIPQFETGGGGSGSVEQCWELDTGSGFVTIANSPIINPIGSNADATFTCEVWVEPDVGDIIRSMWATDSSSIDIKVPTSMVGDTIPSVQQYMVHHGAP